MLRKKYLFIFCVVVLVCTFSIYIYKLKQKPYLTVAGFVAMGDGLGRLAVECLDAVYDDLNANFFPTRKDINMTDVPERIKPLLEKKRHPKFGQVVIYYDSLPRTNKLPRDLKKLGLKNDNQIRIAYSMFEASRIPSKWAEILNSYFDAVAVPDEFLEDVYKLSGVTIPIFVLPIGLDLHLMLNQPLKAKRNDPFCFINTSSLSGRKNPIGVIKAFDQAFHDQPDVKLLMNYRYADKTTLKEVSNLIDSLNAKNIFLTNYKLDNEQYLKYLEQGDAFFSLSKGEGFSIQPREAMALGFPVIISDNTAHTTIVKTGLACAIKCPTTEICDIIPQWNCGDVFVADIDEAAKALKEVYENYEVYLEKAQQRRDWAERYQYKHLKNYYLSLFKPKKIKLSDRNEIREDGLVTNCPELYKKYTKVLKIPAE